MKDKQITSALISVYYKDGLDEIVKLLADKGVRIYSTGGTYEFITGLGIAAEKVEDLTTYPSILGGRVKTLHPSVFGGILARRENRSDMEETLHYRIPMIDLVIVDLYPFEETLKNTGDEDEIIEKIDIGGISLIRAAAKNFNDVLVISGREQYAGLKALLTEKGARSDIEDRKFYAAKAFETSSHYDTKIFGYFNHDLSIPVFRESINRHYPLRYGENPHQKGVFFGDPEQMFRKIHGKELSFNNLLDIESAIGLIDEFTETTVVIIKHNNACGVASRPDLAAAWDAALQSDPVSAYGGVIAANSVIDNIAAEAIDKIFFEIIIARSYTDDALDILQQKKNRIILQRTDAGMKHYSFRSLLNGVLWQERDRSTEEAVHLKPVTPRVPDSRESEDLIFANKIVKHSKSNAIVIVKGKQLCGSGIGQTSRVDALKQAIDKANAFGFDLNGAVLASDAFFPFADSVEIAGKAGITAIVQPGGSVRDKDSVEYCSANNISMVFTGIRHFKH